jgi:ABC-type multidrug transport system ATPase subunit/pSer/pThr/pTyr-binding forkhead associated (FHA) protein
MKGQAWRLVEGLIGCGLLRVMTELNKQLKEAYLLGLSGALAGHKIWLKESRLLIGRDARQCHLVLAEEMVSRRHALLEIVSPQKAIITDLGSRFGTFVNGRAVTQSELRDGDCISLGPGGAIAFTFHLATPLAAQATGIITPGLSAGEQAVVRIGRHPDNEIVLNAPGISRYHASLAYGSGARPILTDLGSTNGTFVNGELVTHPRPVGPDDLIFLGGIVLRLDGNQIQWYDLSASRICAWGLSKEIAGRTILKDVSLAIDRCEFVGLIRPSGCGKSILLDALSGLRPATSGSVYINQLDLYRNFDTLRRSIGRVPQHDILFDGLSVERTLAYAARLRLPAGTPRAEVRCLVEEVMETVGLEEERATPFGQLSGGQQKRLSLGIELITKPSFIFLDEPTSPLDPQTVENLMVLFRRLADEGRIVVMVTHRFERFELMHHVAILTPGGRLAFFGPPREALTYFGCREPHEIYRLLDNCDPERLSAAFQASPQFQRYVGNRIAEAQELARTTVQARLPEQAKPQRLKRGFGLRQWLHLTCRYLEIKLKDQRHTALLFLQPALIAALLSFIARGTLNDANTLFITAIIAIWFGANNAVREIVAEAPIYARERFINLKIPSYACSKFVVLGGLSLIQCALFVSLLIWFGRLSGQDFSLLLLICYLTSLGGIALGLFLSALVNTTEKAISLLPLILIPQLLLAGFLKPLDDLYVNVSKGFKPATAAEYQRFEKMSQTPPRPTAHGAASLPPDVIIKKGGMGASRYASAVIIARWSVEALAHAVSLNDRNAREALATRLYVAQYQQVFDRKPEEEIKAAYSQRVVTDLQVLGGFVVLFLALAMWALKRKDVL